MDKSYQSIIGRGVGEIVEKKSRFLGDIRPVSSEEGAKAVVSEIKGHYHDAKHHVYAFRLKNGYEKYSDDGEPQGTGGQPILDILRKRELTDCICVVTRYFGGILLGTGGLSRAYSDAALLSLDNTKICRYVPHLILSLECDYNQNTLLQRKIGELGGKVTNTEYGTGITLRFALLPEKQEQMHRFLQEFSNGQLSEELITTEFLPE